MAILTTIYVCIFKSIVFGESVRLRRLNKTNELYLKDLERLKKKCIDSYFNKKVVEKIINLAKTWTDRFGPKPLNKNKTTDPMLIWASAFSNLLQLTVKEKSLVQATVVHKRPPQGRRNRPPNPPVGGGPRPGQGPRPLNTNQRPIFKFRR